MELNSKQNVTPRNIFLLISYITLVHGNGNQDSFSTVDLITRLSAAERILAISLTGDIGDNIYNIISKGVEPGELLTSKEPVLFSAWRTTGRNEISSQYIIKFDHVLLNVGNHYNPYDGVFEAPVAGYYQFFWDMTIAKTTVTELVVDGSVKGRTLTSRGTNVESGSANVIVYLTAGDHVWIQTYNSGSYIYSSYHSTFSGFLLNHVY